MLESLARREGIMNFADGDSLLENGVITSIGIYRLVMFFEENFHIHVPDDDLVPDHFRTITHMGRYVRDRMIVTGRPTA